jgi:hypothetical protein
VTIPGRLESEWVQAELAKMAAELDKRIDYLTPEIDQ